MFDRQLHCAPVASFAMYVFFLTPLSRKKLELANDDERYVQNAISATSSGAKPVSGSLSRIRALHIDPAAVFRVCQAVPEGSLAKAGSSQAYSGGG